MVLKQKKTKVSFFLQDIDYFLFSACNLSIRPPCYILAISYNTVKEFTHNKRECIWNTQFAHIPEISMVSFESGLSFCERMLSAPYNIVTEKETYC